LFLSALASHCVLTAAFFFRLDLHGLHLASALTQLPRRNIAAKPALSQYFFFIMPPSPCLLGSSGESACANVSTR